MKLVVLGAGESGVGAAVLGRKKGYDVFVSDRGSIVPACKEVLCQHQIRFEEGQHTTTEIFEATEVIKSPGIPDTLPMIVEMHKRGIPVISEIEFAGRFSRAKMICITGSNGKTTTTMLLYHMLKKAGIKVGLAGNVGYSLARQVAEKNFDHYVVELSSFQLDGMYRFKADIAILLNITPDHLDRYNNKMQNYIDSKFRVIRNQGNTDHFICCSDDANIRKELNKRTIAAKTWSYSTEKQGQDTAWLEKEKVKINFNHKQFDMSIHDLALKGKHNIGNSMAAGIAGRVLEIRKEIVRESMSDFQNIEHRLEFVGKVHGIEFINDSKATNVNSTWYALESINNPVVWIVGGVDKGNDYTLLKDLVEAKVKAIICLGKDNLKIHRAFEGMVDTIVDAGSAIESVTLSSRLADKGDTVILSPCCASFDLFENYEDRGHQFKKAVRSL